MRGKIQKIFLNNIIKENFPNLKKVIPIKVQKAYRTPSRQNKKRISPEYIIIKAKHVQNKERLLKSARGKKQVTYKDRFKYLNFSRNSESQKGLRSCVSSKRQQMPTRLLYQEK